MPIEKIQELSVLVVLFSCSLVYVYLTTWIAHIKWTIWLQKNMPELFTLLGNLEDWRKQNHSLIVIGGGWITVIMHWSKYPYESLGYALYFGYLAGWAVCHVLGIRNGDEILAQMSTQSRRNFTCYLRRTQASQRAKQQAELESEMPVWTFVLIIGVCVLFGTITTIFSSSGLYAGFTVGFGLFLSIFGYAGYTQLTSNKHRIMGSILLSLGLTLLILGATLPPEFWKEHFTGF